MLSLSLRRYDGDEYHTLPVVADCYLHIEGDNYVYSIDKDVHVGDTTYHMLRKVVYIYYSTGSFLVLCEDNKLWKLKDGNRHLLLRDVTCVSNMTTAGSRIVVYKVAGIQLMCEIYKDDIERDLTHLIRDLNKEIVQVVLGEADTVVQLLASNGVIYSTFIDLEAWGTYLEYSTAGSFSRIAELPLACRHYSYISTRQHRHGMAAAYAYTVSSITKLNVPLRSTEFYVVGNYLLLMTDESWIKYDLSTMQAVERLSLPEVVYIDDVGQLYVK